MDIFKALNVLSLIFLGKNIDRINDCDAINAFAAKLYLGGHCRIQKGNAASFSKLNIAFQKNQMELGEAQSRDEWLQFLKQKFERNFCDIKLPKLKMTMNLFRLNNDVLGKDLQKEFRK